MKNFQLVHWDHNTDRKGAQLMLQFGKKEEDVYALDFAYPMTPLVAFAIGELHQALLLVLLMGVNT